MSRIAAVTAVSMAAVAGLAGALLRRLGVESTTAAATALALLFAMLLFEQHSARRREKAAVEARLRRLEDVVERVQQAESPPDPAEEARRAAMAARLSELEMLLRKLGDRLAETETPDHASAAATPVDGAEPDPVPVPAHAEAACREAEPAPSASLAAVAADDPETAHPVPRTVTHARVEEPAPAVPEAAPAAPMAAESLSAETVLRATREALRRAALLTAVRGAIEARRLDVGLLCTLSVATLGDGEFFPDFLALLEANNRLAPRLHFGLAQAEVKAMGPIEIEALRTLAELGFRFSLVAASDLRIDAQELAGHGFRFVKVPLEAILGEAAEATDIHPADFAALLARFGLTLIVDGVARESAVPELLDYGVRCAEGALFGAARLVRAEANVVALPQAAE